MDEGRGFDEEMKPSKYWGEKEWERSMLENERLMDRYEQVMQEHPGRSWKDPFALYLLVHEGIDLGDEPAAESDEAMAERDGPEEIASDEETNALEPNPIEEGGSLREELEKIGVYRLAFSFVLDVHQWLQPDRSELLKKEPGLRALYQHALRVPADIAGGHGLGYEEETLCGNIVKNRWALQHTQAARQLLMDWIQKTKPPVPPSGLVKKIDEMIGGLSERIQSLRSRVWWV